MVQPRHNVRAAVSWQVVAELLRRHHKACQLRVLETHPGGGTYDCLSLCYPRCGDVFGGHLVSFNVLSGHLFVWHPYGTPRVRLEQLGWPEGNNYVLAYLAAEDPKTVVDSIEALVGLPPEPPQLPPTTPPVLVARIVAGVLKRYLLARHRVEVRCGWFDSSGAGGSYVDRWVYEVPGFRDALAAAVAGPWQAQARIAARVWRLQRSGSDASVVLEMATGTAYSGGEQVSLFERYREVGRLLPVVDWVVTRLEA